MSNEKNTIVQLNDQKYYFNVFLINNKGQFFSFTSSSIKELIIKDDMFDFYVTGSLIFENTYDAIERSYENNEGEIIEGYSFGAGNRDYLYVEITPRIGEQDPDALNPEVWKLQYNFVISEIEDILGDTPDKKYKKLYLHEDVYQTMLEKNLQFSTTTMLLSSSKSEGSSYSETSPSHRVDADRMQNTGNIIKELIKTGIGNTQEFDDEWDTGQTKIYYTSHPNAKMIDDLEYVMTRHVSGEEFLNDFSLLSYGRYTKKWQLKPFIKTLRGALYTNDKTLPGIEQLERFSVVEMGETDDKLKINSKRVPVFHDKNLTFNMYFGEYSLIDKYTLYDMAFCDQHVYVNTKIAHSYDYFSKSFVIKQTGHDISSVENFFREFYVDNLKNPNYNNYPLMNIDHLRRTNQNVTHVFDTGYDTASKLYHIGRNLALKSNVLLNTSINFSVRGLTSRKSGKFFSISKDNKYIDSEYEAKLQGQWVLTKVEHIFKEDTYTNNIFGTKLNKFREL